MSLRFESLSADRIRQLPTAQTVFFFPVGGLEDHGPHLPVGMDLIEAQKYCQEAANRLESEMPGWVGVVMPSAPLAIDLNTSDVALSVRAHVLRDWLVDACLSLHRIGFCRFVCFSGTSAPRQLTAIEEASRLVRQKALGNGFKRWSTRWADRPVLISATSCWVTQKDVMKSPLWPNPQEHGGGRDTSYALWLASEWVSGDWQELPELKKNPTSPRSRWWKRFRRRLSGYWGNPKEARADIAEQELKTRLHEIFPKFRAIWEGANPEMIARSWYSVFPPNKSFFKAWLVLVGFVVIMSLWVYVSFNAMISY